MLQLLPIFDHPIGNNAFVNQAACQLILAAFGPYYKQIGYQPPWIGYFAAFGERIVGTGGFRACLKIALWPENGSFGNLSSQLFLKIACYFSKKLLLRAPNPLVFKQNFKI